MRATFKSNPGEMYAAAKQAYGEDEVNIIAFLAACEKHMKWMQGLLPVEKVISFFYSYHGGLFKLSVEGRNNGVFDGASSLQDVRGDFLSSLATALSHGSISQHRWTAPVWGCRGKFDFRAELEFICTNHKNEQVHPRDWRRYMGGKTYTGGDTLRDWDIDDMSYEINKEAFAVAKHFLRTIEKDWLGLDALDLEASFFKGGVKLNGFVYKYADLQTSELQST